MKVSVWMSAYNHEKYISQCLDSVLNQKTDFEFEIILGEDCSKDRTREIAIEYQKKNPDKIKLLLPQKNIGMMPMDIATWKMCTGEFIALLNGDDYWTDENKLQTQVNFLEENPDTVMCFHKARVENDTDGSSFETAFLEPTSVLPIESLLLGYNPVMTPTVMFRNVIDIPDWFIDLPYGDMPLYLMLAEKGKIQYIDKNMCIYRIHSNGDWQGDSVSNNLLKDVRFYVTMNEKLEYRYDRFMRRILAQRLFDLVIFSIRKRSIIAARKYYKKLISVNSDFNKENREDIKILYRILFDRLNVKACDHLINRKIKWEVN